MDFDEPGRRLFRPLESNQVAGSTGTKLASPPHRSAGGPGRVVISCFEFGRFSGLRMAGRTRTPLCRVPQMQSKCGACESTLD